MRSFIKISLALTVSTILFSEKIYTQTLLLEENFDYTVGELYTVSSGIWGEYPGGSTHIEVITGNLSYTNYPSSNIGAFIALNGGANGRAGAGRSFATQAGNGMTVYASFLLRITSTTDMDTSGSDGDYFASFQTDKSSTRRAHIYVKQGSNLSKFSIGIDKTSSTSLEYYSIDLDVNTTYLVVVAYLFQSGYDEVKLWINPDLSGEEPPADVEISSGADTDSLNYFQFFQREFSGDMEIDGLRISTSWSQAPLPVELTQFNGHLENGKVHLKWETATEVNNYGFQVERKKEKAESGWEKIGFVEGYGNSNSPKQYEFIDLNPPLGLLEYRLKQIDLDGTYEFYDMIVEVDLSITGLDEKETPTEVSLLQNHPNPFNPITIIQYSIPNATDAFNASNVTLKIYDIIGREIATLVNETKPPGKYEVEFNGSNLPSGIYYYSLQFGGKNTTRKMILLK